MKFLRIHCRHQNTLNLQNLSHSSKSKCSCKKHSYWCFIRLVFKHLRLLDFWDKSLGSLRIAFAISFMQASRTFKPGNFSTLLRVGYGVFLSLCNLITRECVKLRIIDIDLKFTSIDRLTEKKIDRKWVLPFEWKFKWVLSKGENELASARKWQKLG